MRGRLQQICRQLVTTPRGQSCSGWLVALLASVVYLLTMERTASWWDCGEFIATGYGLQVGHPPGAPLYQLLSHCFMLLSFGHPLWVAPLSNAFSAICAGLTSMLLFRSALLLLQRASFSPLGAFVGALTGALCYTFCDTAWFSAVESEVYALAMLFCALDVWLMLRWEQSRNPRLLLLLSLLMGLGVCVHLMTLLVSPFLLWVLVRSLRREGKAVFPGFWALLLMVLFFFLGLTPYAVVPIRAAANPPINEGHPATTEEFLSYIRRDQYQKAPLYPRMWRSRDADHWAEWGGTDGSLWSNTKYYVTYQLGYMYFRYLMYNFIGRENLSYAFGPNAERGGSWRTPDGQFQPYAGGKGLRYPVFVIPFLLGLCGMWLSLKRRRGDFLALLMLFLFGGIILNFYLNHPCYEPRSRDYAYILSFYAFSLWIAFGAAMLTPRRSLPAEGEVPAPAPKKPTPRWKRVGAWSLLALAPLLMAVGNWPDHDRSQCHSVHDFALAHLQSCDTNALLFTYGDNDTFPLWYLQHVERRRPDMQVININLTGYTEVLRLMASNAFRRPVYFSQYAYDQFAHYFPGRLRCEGFCWRLLPSSEGVDDLAPLRRHVEDSIQWHIRPGEFVPRVSRSFMRIWNTNTQAL